MGVMRKDGDGPTLAFKRAEDPLHLVISQNTKEWGNFSTCVAQIKVNVVKIKYVKHLAQRLRAHSGDF